MTKTVPSAPTRPNLEGSPMRAVAALGVIGFATAAGLMFSVMFFLSARWL